MSALPIKNAFDTARLTAYYRALASEQPGARIHDPYARLLAGDRGAEIMQAVPLGAAGMWAIMMRTNIYDEIILRLIINKEIDAVVNLGAGLDTRPYRLTLPASFRWIDVDYPDMLAYKSEKLAHVTPVCSYKHIPLDILNKEARRAFLSQLDQDSKVLVLTEGLLAYLTTEQVASIAVDLREQPAIHWWLTEFASLATFERDNNAWNSAVGDGAKIRFAPASGVAFFQLYGWHVAEFRYSVREALRLHLPLRKKWLARLYSLLLPRKPDATYSGDGFVLLQCKKDLARVLPTDKQETQRSPGPIER